MLDPNQRSRVPKYDPNIRVAPGIEEDLPQALELAVRGFRDILRADELDELANSIDNTFSQGHITTLRHNDKLVGFLNGIELYQNRADEMSLYVHKKIMLSCNPHMRKRIEKEYARQAEQFGKGKVVVEFGDSEFNRAAPLIQDNDYYLQTMVIEPEFRGRGYGHIMLDSFLCDLQLTEGGRVFSDCLEGSGSEELFRKHGFQAMGRFGPTHHTGQSSLFVCLWLNKPEWHDDLRLPKHS